MDGQWTIIHAKCLEMQKGEATMKIKVLLLITWFAVTAAVQAQQAQPKIVAEGGGVDDYGSTRVLFWNTQADSAAGQFAINYGRPVWKKDYEDAAKFDSLTKGKIYRLGSNFWTSLDTCLPLKVSGRKVPVGEYYLGLRRSEDGSKWSLAFIDPAGVRGAHLDAFQIQKAKVMFEAPMSQGKAGSKAERLTLTFSYPKENPKKVTLRVAWGDLALEAPVEVALAE